MGKGKGKGSNWTEIQGNPTSLREEAVSRAVRGEAKGGISTCFVYLSIFPLFAAVTKGNILSRLITMSDV